MSLTEIDAAVMLLLQNILFTCSIIIIVSIATAVSVR